MTLQATTSKLALIGASCLVLAACASSGSGSQTGGDSDRINQALERTANSVQASGDSAQSVGILERLYARNPKDEGLALKYASALRDAEYYNRAMLVLSPFAEKASSTAAVKSEFASIHLALGNYPQAEQYAQKAIVQDPTNAQAYQALGIALDAQNMYPEAERAYRKGLDNWKGDPSSIINNLALNLASQDYLEEAIELLEKAQAVSPNRTEIERNLRIIRALLETKQISTGQAADTKPKRKAPEINLKSPEKVEVKTETKTEVKVEEKPISEVADEPVEDDSQKDRNKLGGAN
ncbi:MAG TPA: tetratricopeptide repeat protein [Alphaproteobacteria bacterium]|nr:tetratricopeptide repeat protein [Alphaproteobacteria bacterium]